MKSISKLEKNEFVEIDFLSTGCFHRIHSTLSFSGKNLNQLGITNYYWRDKTEEKEKVAESISISKKDIESLDDLLNFYRVSKPNGCTTSDATLALRAKVGCAGMPFCYMRRNIFSKMRGN